MHIFTHKIFQVFKIEIFEKIYCKVFFFWSKQLFTCHNALFELRVVSRWALFPQQNTCHTNLVWFRFVVELVCDNIRVTKVDHIYWCWYSAKFVFLLSGSLLQRLTASRYLHQFAEYVCTWRMVKFLANKSDI